MNNLRKLMGQPSTAAGAGLLAAAGNEMLVSPETLSTMQNVAEVALPVLLNPTPMGLAMAALGLFAMFRSEGSGK